MKNWSCKFNGGWGCIIDDDTGRAVSPYEAFCKVQEQAAEIERLRAYHLRAEEAGQRQALRADAAEAKLREAVEVMRDLDTSDMSPPDRKRVFAFLATMETNPH